MIRADMISTIGRVYLTSNIENDEYSYPKAFSAASLTFSPIQNSTGRRFEKLDIRFVKDNISVLIETKQNFNAADEEQLSAYVEYEKALTGNKVIKCGAELFLMAILCRKKQHFAQWMNMWIFTPRKSTIKKR